MTRKTKDPFTFIGTLAVEREQKKRSEFDVWQVYVYIISILRRGQASEPYAGLVGV